MEESDIVARLGQVCSEAGSRSIIADRFGVSRQYIADVLAGKRPPGPSVLTGLGIEKKVVFEEIEQRNMFQGRGQ